MVITIYYNGLEGDYSCSRSSLEHEIRHLHQIGELVFHAALRYQATMSDKSIEDLARKLAEALKLYNEAGLSIEALTGNEEREPAPVA